MTFWIPCGAGLAAAGLYTLFIAGTGIRTAIHWVGWSLYGVGGGLIAGSVLVSTGSFWKLLLFCVVSTAALVCATIGVVRNPGVIAADTAKGKRLRVGNRVWFAGAAASIALILVSHEVYWSGGLLLMAALALGTSRMWISREDAESEFDAIPAVADRVREPALACLMWGVLTWGLMTALLHGRVARENGFVSVDAARLNNLVVVACGVLSLGLLQIVTREQAGSRLTGLGCLLLGVLLVCSAGANRSQSELLCLVAVACFAVPLAVHVRTPQDHPAELAAGPNSLRGDA